MITIQELLYNRGLSRTARTKLVRHTNREIDVWAAYRTDRKAFLEYQSFQSKDRFNGVEYVVSFIADENSTARFVGVYRIDGCASANGGFRYAMTEIEGFDDLKERIVVRWNNTVAWHQWIKNSMEVADIRPGLLYKRFTDYLDLLLSFEELQEIVVNDYQDWHAVLSAVKGIYLITDTHTGKLYVGSAYGENGIWGRWKDYVETNGHGNNKSLTELVKQEWDYAVRYFQFSILMLLPKTVTTEEAIAKEQLFKQKLGTNAFGLNNN